jgi:phosphonatase-like hydrolase
MNVELVVFDLSGTTVRDHDAVGRHLRATMIMAGVEVSREEVAAVLGIPRDVALCELLTLRRGRAPEREVIAALHEDFVDRMIHHYWSAPGIGEMPGATILFRELRRRGVRVALETGFRRRVMNAILDRLEWREGEHFDVAVATDDVPRGRPHPDSLYAVMRRTGVSQPRTVAKVGDTPADLQAAAAAGCGWILGLANESIPREDMLAHPQALLIQSLAEVLPLLESSSFQPPPGEWSPRDFEAEAWRSLTLTSARPPAERESWRTITATSPSRSS